MKKLLILLGSIFAAVLLALAAYFFYFFIFIQPVIDEESKKWVDETIPQIVSTWNVDEMITNSSPEFLSRASREEIERLFSTLSVELGGLEKYLGSKGEAGVEIHNGYKTTKAQYLLGIEFEKRPAEIAIEGIKEDGVWKILGFHVNIKDPSNL